MICTEYAAASTDDLIAFVQHGDIAPRTSLEIELAQRLEIAIGKVARVQLLICRVDTAGTKEQRAAEYAAWQ
jgi:hypothetical protein